jgi:hypothetical protein
MDVPNLSEGLMGISQRTAIWCLDGAWGIVDEVLVDDAGHVTALVGRPNSTEEHDHIILLDLIAQVDSDRVTLNCTLADLPTYAQETITEHEEPELD